MNCQLDSEVFTCCKCGKKTDHTDGTWLPVGIEDKRKLPIESVDYLSVLGWSDWLKPPEIITSDEFTCYDCT